MYLDKKILCTIPARGGSKGVPRKNIKLLQGQPLIGYAIAAAKGSKYIDRVVVSTDDHEIADVAKAQGAEVPTIRPAELATDTVAVVPALQHMVSYLGERELFKGEVHVLIQSTSPLVQSADIDAAIEKFFATGSNSCVSVCEISDRPEWMYKLEGDRISPFIESAPNMRRQDMPTLYRLNGAIYVTKMDVLMKGNLIYDNESCAAIIMPIERSIDIDTPLDFQITEILLAPNTGT